MVLYIHGNGQRIRIPNRTAINNLTDYTYSFWIYLLVNNATSTPNIISKNYSSNNSFITYISGENLIFRTVNNTAVSVQVPNHKIPRYQWLHITSSYRASDGRMDLYVNGLPVQNATNTNCINSGTVADLLINANGTIKFSAYFKDFKMWTSKLTDQQVLDQYLGIGEDNVPTACWYPCDEGTGSPADKISPLNVMNLADQTNAIKWATLEETFTDRYLDFDGMNDSVSLGVQSDLWSNTALKKFSFSLWVKFDQLSDGTNSREIFNRGWATTHGFDLYILSTLNRLEWEMVATTWPTRICSMYHTLDVNLIGKWINITVTYDSTAPAGKRNLLYVNGSKTGLVVATDNAGQTLTSASLATLGGTANDHDGNIDDLRWWNDTLTPDQAKQIYQRGRKGGNIDPDSELTFDGTDDFVSCGNHTDLWSRNLRKISFSIWVYMDSPVDVNTRVVDHNISSNNGFGVYCPSATQVIFRVRDTVNHEASATIASMIGKWTNIIGVWDADQPTNNVKVYVDGVLGGTLSTGNATINLSNVLYIGSGIVPLDTIRGRAKNFQWFNDYVLRQEEVTSIFNAGMDADPLFIPSYHIRLNEGTGVTILDTVSRVKTATLSGSPIWINKSIPNYWLPMKEGINSPIDSVLGKVTTLTGPTWINNKPATGDLSFNIPLACKIKIQSNDETQTYFLYDSNGQKPFKLGGIRFSLGDDETDIANVLIEDSDDLLDNAKLSGGVKYFIYLTIGEYSVYEGLFVGYADLCEINATERNKIYKMITIYGSYIYGQWRYLNYNRSAKLSDLDDPSVIADPNFSAHAHMTRAISKQSELLYDKLIIDEELGWDKTFISRKVDTIIGGIVLGRVTLADFARFLKSITGASTGVRLKNEKEEFFFEYPSQNFIPVTLKSGYEKALTDKATETTYCYAPFTKTIDSTLDVRHTTILHGITELTDEFISGSKEFAGSTSLTFKAVVQYLPLPADAKRIKQVNFMLSMRGEVSSPQNKVNGALYLVDAQGNPKGTRLDRFEIPLSDIKSNPEIVSVSVDVDPDDITGNSFIAVKLYNRSGTDEIDKGEPNHDETNTILWYHNNKIGVGGQFKSGIAPEGDRSKEPNLNWQITDRGPQFACSIFSDIRRIQTVMSPQLFPTYGIRETVIDVSQLRDKTTIINFLHYTAYILSLPKSYISQVRIKIPNNVFFRPNQILFMSVSKPHIAEQMRIKRVEYNLQMLPDQSGFNQSSRICIVTLLGTFNPADQVTFNCDV